MRKEHFFADLKFKFKENYIYNKKKYIFVLLLLVVYFCRCVYITVDNKILMDNVKKDIEQSENVIVVKKNIPKSERRDFVNSIKLDELKTSYLLNSKKSYGKSHVEKINIESDNYIVVISERGQNEILDKNEKVIRRLNSMLVYPLLDDFVNNLYKQSPEKN